MHQPLAFCYPIRKHLKLHIMQIQLLHSQSDYEHQLIVRINIKVCDGHYS